MLSYVPEDHLPRSGKENRGLGSPKSIINQEMPHRASNGSNSSRLGSLFQVTVVCFKMTKTSQDVCLKSSSIAPGPACLCLFPFSLELQRSKLGRDCFLSSELMTPQFEIIRTDSTKMYVFNEYLWDPYLFLTRETQGCAYNLSPAATTVFAKP